MTAAVHRPTAIERFLNVVERTGNALPHPTTLFAVLSLMVLCMSAIGAWLDLSAVHPSTGETIRAVNLLSVEGIHKIALNLVTNFASFAPLGTVLVALIGIAVAEHSGMIGALLRLVVLNAPRVLLTPIVVFAGVMSNAASEIGYVLLVPLAALMYIAVGRHPLIGLAAAFAGVSGGYSANLVLGTVDPLLAGLSQEAARIIDSSYTVNAAANYYFMAVSTFLIVALGSIVTERIIAPRFSGRVGEDADAAESDHAKPLSTAEKRGLVAAGIATAVLVGIVLVGILPEGGFLRALNVAADREILESPLLKGIVAFIFLFGVVVGITYGVVAGTIKSDVDVIRGMDKSMATLGGYLVLVFFAAQFVAFFNWSNMGLILAIDGAEFLKALGLPKIPLFLGFILLTAVVNLVMGSASAKWALMAPIFIPMFMLLGYPPETTQVAYRIGDSVTNIISPMMSYFALIIAFVQKYESKAGIGTLVALMLPYSIVFFIGWSVLFSAWVALGLPMGPGSPVSLPIPG